MAFGAVPYVANRLEQRALATMMPVGAIRFCDNLSRQVQPPDAENRMPGGVGGVTGAIPLPPTRSGASCKVASIQRSGIEGFAASMFLDSTKLH